MIHDVDVIGVQLHAGDIVTLPGWAGEVFQIKSLQYPGDAIIENIHPGGRLGTSTVPCDSLVRGTNNSGPRVRGWDYTYEEPDLSPLAGTVLPCGCYARSADLQAVLCQQHLIEVNL
jgi:hypothetical protein